MQWTSCKTKLSQTLLLDLSLSFFSFFHFEIPVFAKGHLQPSGTRPVTALAQKELVKIHHKLHDLDWNWKI